MRAGFLRTAAGLPALVALAAGCATVPPAGKEGNTNYDEALVGSYTLPPLFASTPANQADARQIWENRRRAEVLQQFEQNQFGRTPAIALSPRLQVVDNGTSAFDGKAVRQQFRLNYAGNGHNLAIRVVLFVPAGVQEKVPVLLHVGFSPNALVFEQPGMDIGLAWDVREKRRIPDAEALLLAGFEAEPFLEAGFAVAHVYYGDIEPDFDGGGAYGIRSLLGEDTANRAPDQWGAIGAWGWGFGEVADALAQNPAIDGQRIALSGASRIGKSVLWAAARDRDFALIMPLISGEGGASLSRRDFGETIADLTAPGRYSYWFAPRYRSYADREDALPVDAHMLLALIAPRPMLLVNGTEDLWSDSRGEVQAAEAARPIYAAYGAGGNLQVHTHSGGHELLPEDLARMVAFMQTHFGDPAS